MKTDSQLMLIAGGAAAILLALVWRSIARRRHLSRLRRHLQDDHDPADRARAGNAIIELGLPRAAKPVLRAVTQEPDERVRLSLALAVARRQWEPAKAQRVVHLRGWASEELEFQGRPVQAFGPAVTRLADMGGPRAPWQGDVAAANGNGNGNGNGADGAVPAPEAPAADLAGVASHPGNGNGSGYGYSARGHGASDEDYEPDEPTIPVAVTRTDGGIRWVAPDIGERTES